MSVMPVLDMDHLRSWIGCSESRDDPVSSWTATAMAATLRNEEREWQIGEALPPLWHWTYFLATAAQNRLGPDGHPARGGFLPPVPLPRRMWAGSQLEFMAPLRVGTTARRTSTVTDVVCKEGKTGPLVFVNVAHEVHVGLRLHLREVQNIVYREAAVTGESSAPQAPPVDADWTLDHQPDAALLFRYSALTFNSHRIHYDHPYATRVEGYADLVVHGPLIATLLLEAAQQHNAGRAVRSFSFRAVRPLVCQRRLRLRGQLAPPDGSVNIWAEDGEGALLMQGTVRFE